MRPDDHWPPGASSRPPQPCEAALAEVRGHSGRSALGQPRPRLHFPPSATQPRPPRAPQRLRRAGPCLRVVVKPPWRVGALRRAQVLPVRHRGPGSGPAAEANGSPVNRPHRSGQAASKAWRSSSSEPLETLCESCRFRTNIRLAARRPVFNKQS